MKSASIVALVLNLVLVTLIFTNPLQAIDIPTMTWKQRSDWINVKAASAITGGPSAKGDGIHDDTAAIQAALNYVVAHFPGQHASKLTLYFPTGVYLISNTLTLNVPTAQQPNPPSVGSIQLIGCGSGTVISWTGANGQAMLNANATYDMRYIGLTWNGNGNAAGTTGASCAYEHCSQKTYETQIRHENECFENFTAPGTYSYLDGSGNSETPATPPAGIISGFPAVTGGGLTGDVMIFNCHFLNCGTGVISALDVTNNFMWTINGCEFDQCGVGIDFHGGYDYIVSNTHFQQSTYSDIADGGNVRVHHCTSSGSGQFVTNTQGANTLQDCWVDSWTSTYGAVQFATQGPDMVYDCNFTHPPAGSRPPLQAAQYGSTEQDYLLSNDYAPGFSGGAALVQSLRGAPYRVDVVPAGQRTGIVTSPTETFLQSSPVTDGGKIIDVTAAPYSADPTGTNNASTAIQTAITKAKLANNGSIVYIPAGDYKLTSTLNLSGSNYSVQGAGYATNLRWYGGSNGVVFNVTTPAAIAVQLLRIDCLSNLSGTSGYSSSAPISDPTTITGLEETATGASSLLLDDVHYDASTYQSDAQVDNSTGPGVVLSSLPAGSTVSIPHLDTPLAVQNCGAAQILSKFLQFGQIHVSGTGAKTGFLGFDVAEGGQQENSAGYNVNVTDNQDLVIGDYYSEQTWNDVSAQAGSGTATGRLTIEGLGSESGNNSGSGSPTFSLNVNNYAGRVYYGSQTFLDYAGKAAVNITQSGANAVDLILAGNYYYDGQVITPGGGANLIEAVDQDQFPGGSLNNLADNPNPLTLAAGDSISAALDHFRQLGERDFATSFNVVQAVTNNGFELDATNPSPATALGDTPAAWTVNNALAAGSGVRNGTVVAGGSPFSAGTQNLLFVDSTGSSTGSPLQVAQGFTATAASSPAIETFDFCCTAGSVSDVWVFTGVGSGIGPGVHITSHGSTVYLGANINGSDTYCNTLTPGAWYRARIVMTAPSGGKANATLYVTPWNSGSAGSTSSYTIDGIPAAESTGFTALYLNSGSAAGTGESLNFDNIGIVANGILNLP